MKQHGFREESNNILCLLLVSKHVHVKLWGFQQRPALVYHGQSWQIDQDKNTLLPVSSGQSTLTRLEPNQGCKILTSDTDWINMVLPRVNLKLTFLLNDILYMCEPSYCPGGFKLTP